MYNVLKRVAPHYFKRSKVKYHIIVNGAKLRGRNAKKLKAVEEIFAAANVDYTVRRTERKGHESEIAREITSSSSGNCIVAMGGDGTLHKILNGFESFTDNCMALIPLGTGNDFAAAAGIPRNVKKAAALILEREAKYTDFIELSNGLRSINAVGTGIDVDVLKRVYDKNGRKKSTYLHGFLMSVIRFESIKYTVSCDGCEQSSRGLIALIGNGRQIGGGIKVCPDANISDGLMDVLIIDYLSKGKLLGALIKLLRGKINKIKQVTAVKCKSVKFTLHSGEGTLQADGELYDGVPFEARIVTDTLKFVY